MKCIVIALRKRSCRSLLFVGLVVSFSWHAPVYAEGMDEASQAIPGAEQRTWKTLAERIPSVTGRIFRKVNRLELTPVIGLGFNDPFFTHIPLGGHVLWHLHEDWSLGIAGEYLPKIEKSIPVFPPDATKTSPEFSLQFLAKGQLQWAPIYGKISWLAEGISHFDTYLALSGGVAGRGKSGFTYAVGAAVGQRYFLSSWLALRAELRLDLLPLKRSTNIPDRLQGQLSAVLGASFFLPNQ